jgi:hypothetical protein
VRRSSPSARLAIGPGRFLISLCLSATALSCCFVPAIRGQSPRPCGGISPCTLLSADSSGDNTEPALLEAHRERDDWVAKWRRTADKARSEQPRFLSPLVTSYVLLVQQYRYDSSWQTNSTGTGTVNYGNGRGLAVIPNSRLEVQIVPPPYIVHSGAIADGVGDVSMSVKLRAFSAPEGKGDYFVGITGGVSFPSGSVPNGVGHTVFSPALGLGKGWGALNIQNAFSGSLPTGDARTLGRAFIWNTAAQYRIKPGIWPMIEQNSTFFSDGPNSGKKQTFLTPGILFGTFRFGVRSGVSVGGGVQIAVTRFHAYDHRWILSVRFPF